MPKSLFEIYQQLEPTPGLVFRGDTREPQEIFANGFTRRGATFKHYKKTQEVEELTIRIRDEGRYDIKPSSAVCLTTAFDIAPLFPVASENEEEDPPTHTWIYVIAPQNAYATYKMQTEKESPLAFGKEIAMRDVPPGDVLCAIKCERFINVNADGQRIWDKGMHYRLVDDIVWNPNLGDKQTPLKMQRRQQIENIFQHKRDKYIQCPIPMYEEDDKAVIEGRFSTDGKEITEMQHQVINFVNCTKLFHATGQGLEEAWDFLQRCDLEDFKIDIPGMDMTFTDYVFSSGIDEFAEYLLYSNVRPTEHLEGCTLTMDYFLKLPQEKFVEIYEFKQELKNALATNTDDDYQGQVSTILKAFDDIHRVANWYLDTFLQKNYNLFDSINENQSKNAQHMKHS